MHTRFIPGKNSSSCFWWNLWVRSGASNSLKWLQTEEIQIFIVQPHKCSLPLKRSYFSSAPTAVELHDLWSPFQPILCFSEKKKYSFHFNPLKVCYGTTDHTQIVNMGCCIFNWCCFVLCLNLFHFTSDREKGKILLQFHTIQPIINTINKLPLLLHVLFATSGIFLPPPFSAPVCWPIRKK